MLGRIKSSSQTTGAQTYDFADYSYDLSGALVSQTYPSGRIVTTETDDIGRLSSVKSRSANGVESTMLSQLDYTSFGAVRQAKLGNGKWESAQFDPKRLQVTQIGLGGSAGDTSLLKLEFNYGTTANNGALMQQKITVPGAASQIIQNYDYDYLNRLHSATETVTGNSTPTWKQTFTYDRFGNRRFDANNTTTIGSCSQAVCNPNIDTAKNQLSSSDGYSFDGEGNLTANPENQTFSYDSENRLLQVDNSSTQTTSKYSYDGSGKRVKKTVGDEETIFVYDAFGKLVAEYTLNQTPTQTGIQYMTADALGSPRVITNAIGAVVSRRDLMPFGEEVSPNIGGRTTVQGYGQSDKIRQKFTGYERDDESGLDFAQNRYYSGKHGRFTAVDPLTASANIQSPQSLNRYSYGNNSPYKFTDSLGLASNCVAGNCTESQYDGTQDQIDEGKEKEREFNRGLARYIFGRLSQGYIDDTGGMTMSMFTATRIAQPANAGRSTSDSGKEMLAAKGMEDRAVVPYKDGDNNCTVGIGHLLHRGKCDAQKYGENDTRTYSDDEINEFFKADIKRSEDRLIVGFRYRLSQAEFDALVMLTFNFPGFFDGKAPKLARALGFRENYPEEGRPNPMFRNADAIQREWSDINKVNGQVSQGLVNRRRRELDLFFNGAYYNGH